MPLIVPGWLRMAWWGAIVAVAGCAVGPDYHKPAAELPPAWQPDAPWHEAAPSDTALKGDWWRLFQDDTLNPLVERALSGNQDLRVAAARLEQAREQVTVARSDLFPWVGLSAEADRGKTSANRPLAEYSVPNQSIVQNNFELGPTVNYEVDLFGRVRREVEGARASAQQAEADFENTRLILTAQLVTDYFALRELDAEIAVVRHSLELQRDALGFIASRHDLGYATGLDLAQQEALVEASATQLELLNNQRAQYQHAIATLVGTPAPGFMIAPALSTAISAGDTPGRALGFIAAPPGRSLGGAFHGRGQCPHRRGPRRLLSEHHAELGFRRAQCRLAEQRPGVAVRGAEPPLVARAVRHPDAFRCRENPGERAHRECRLLRGRGGLPPDGADRHGRGGERHYGLGRRWAVPLPRRKPA